MSDNTGIEWTDATWNPLVGCTKVSPGCDHCYAENLVNRFAGTSAAFPTRFDTVNIRDEKFLTQPLRWAKPRRVFVNSLSDLFHKDVPDEYIAKVFAVMAQADHHTFQLLTKRHARMRSLLSSPEFFKLVDREWCSISNWHDGRLREDAWPNQVWPLPNVWLGVSVEDQHWADLRISALLRTPAAVRFISAEPLLGPVDLTWLETYGINALAPDWMGGPGGGTGAPHPLLDWVIAGGESGPGARPMHPQWAADLRDQCAEAGTPFLFKQWGSWAPVTHGTDWKANPKTDGWMQVDGKLIEPFEDLRDGDGTEILMRRQRKETAGRHLDGQLHDGYPAVSA